MNEDQNNSGEKDFETDEDISSVSGSANAENIDNAKTRNAKEKIIIAIVLLAGAWSLFFALLGKTFPNVGSLKNSILENAKKTSSFSKAKGLPNKKYKKAKDFSLVDLNGNIVKLSSFKGKTVFIDFWASWCPPCKMSTPYVKKLHAKMKNNPNVVVLGINCWEEKKKAVNYVKREGISYPVLIADDAVGKNYNVTSIPRFFIIDAKGNIINEYSGWHPSFAEKWEDDIEEALSAPLESSAALANRPPLSDLDGKTVNIADYKGKTVFLAFWIMSSYASMQARPAYKAVNDKISKMAGAKFFSVNVDLRQSGLKAFIEDNNIKYPVLRATQNFADSYGVSSAYPACVIIDKNGKIVKTFFGYSEGDEKIWLKTFNEILKAK
ncbi:MAG: redoxin family protein [Endomicrobium sp.]|jgi:thiol-disulfide isomerase/thioredoxin|nr:redoxin family protein [Endomicrobium sp.]